MADSFTMTPDFYEWVVEGISIANQDVIGNANFMGRQSSEGMYVRLTALGTISGSADPEDPVPFKAIAVERLLSDGLFATTTDPITFNPDDVSGDANIILDYVYEINGNQNLVGTIQWITLHTYKVGDGDMYWGFDSAKETIELAKINADSSPGTYSGIQVDEDLVATGKLYDGIDLPILTCLQPGREHIPSGTYVHVLRKGGKALFFWKDPQVEMGPAGSPPADDNGDFDSFFDDAGAYGGNDYNYDAADGIYKHRRLIAVGSSSGSGSGGTAAGLKITPIDDHNSKIELVDENGTVIPPTSSPVTYCADIVYDNNAHELTITTRDSNANVICTNTVELSTFCATPEFDTGTRILKITTRDDQGNIICEPDVKIPCCDTKTYTTNGPGTPNEPYPPTQYPPTVNPGICNPPVVTCIQADAIDAIPVAKDTLMAAINVQTDNTTGAFSISVEEVFDPNGNDIQAFFEGKAANTEYWFNGGTELKVGKYTFVFKVTNTSADANCIWPDFEIKCVRTITDDCGDNDSTDDGAGTDNCEEGSAAYCDDYSIELSPNSCVLNVDRTAEDTRQLVTITVDLDLNYGAQPNLGITILGKPTETGTTYSKKAVFRKVYSNHDADKSFLEEYDVDVSNIKVGSAAADGKTSNTKHTGRIRISYSNRNKSCTVKFVDWETFSTVPVAAKDGMPAIYDPKNDLNANGNLTVTVVVTNEDQWEDANDLVGLVFHNSSCCEESIFDIVGGTDAALFFLKATGDGAEIYVKKNQNTSKPSYNLQIRGECLDSGAPVGSCVDTQTFNILLCKSFETLTAVQATGPGVAGAAVASLKAGDALGDLVASHGVPDAEWAISAISEVDQPLVASTTPYFVIQPGINGQADMINNFDLPDGEYTVSIQARNAQMALEGKLLEEEIVITIDNSSTYVPSKFKGLT